MRIKIRKPVFLYLLFTLILCTSINILNPLDVEASRLMDRDLARMIDELAEDYHQSFWNISLSQYKAWIALISLMEAGNYRYRAHSSSIGVDKFYHIADKEKEVPFAFSTGVGPFQLTSFGSQNGPEGSAKENWGTWSTIDKLDPKLSLISVLRWHRDRFGDPEKAKGITLENVSKFSAWFAVRPDKEPDFAPVWKAIAGYEWEDCKTKNIDVNFDPSNPQFTLEDPFSKAVEYKDKVYWCVWDNDTGTCSWNDYFDTWFISAKSYSYPSQYTYYYACQEKTGQEMWVWNDSNESFIYRFARDYRNTHLPTNIDGNYAGFTYTTPALDPSNVYTVKKPNLTFYQRSGWSDKIVVSTVKNTYTDSSPLYTTDTLYVDWAVINDGPVATLKGFSVTLYIDGVLKTTWSRNSPLNAYDVKNDYWPVTDYSIGKLTQGTHTLKIVADSANVISESNEDDNEYTKTINVQAPCIYTLTTKISPAGSGTITRNPDKPTYCSGDMVNLTAIPNPGYSFKSWSGVDSKDGATATVTMSKNRTVTANFIKVSETISTPTILSGPSTGTVGTSYTYSTGGSSSNLGHSVKYQFDWKGDGTDLSSWGSATQSKTWSTPGTYSVKSRAQCATDTSVMSGWSSGLSVTITVSETVSIPNIPSGSASGITGTSYSYSTGGSASNFGHPVEYQFDWKGDASDLSPWGPPTQSKTWNASGTCNVRARARCATDTSVISAWSSGLSVNITIPQNNPPNTPTGVNQFRSDGVTAIPEGGTTPESTVIFKGTVSDPDAEQVKLQIELRQITESFTDTPTWESSLVNSGTQVSWTRGGLVNANYKWRYRAMDARGLNSSWVEFGIPGNTDFVVNVVSTLPPPTLLSPGSGSAPGASISTTTPTFQWQAVSGAARYGLYISQSPYGQANLVYQNENISGSSTSFPLPSGYLQNGGQYRWNMTTFNSAGQNGDFSSHLYFVVSVSKTVSFVTVNPSSWTFSSSGTKQLTATATYTDNSTEDVTTKATWTSSNSNVATVNNSGLVTFGQNGFATITAAYGGQSGTCQVSVNIVAQIGVLSVTTTPVSGAIYVDDSYKGSGSWSGTLNVGSHKVSFGDVSGYTTPPAQTVTVIANQTISAIGTYIPVSKTVSWVTVNPSSLTFTSSGTQPLSATATYTDNSTEDITAKASWASSNSNVAAVNNSGFVTPGQNGFATITATYGGKTGTCSVTVSMPPICVSSSLSVTINSPSSGFIVRKGTPTLVEATVQDNCFKPLTSATVTASFSTGDSGIALYDDGLHNDGAANDGVYANTWVPNNSGPCTITVNAAQPGLTAGGASVIGTVAPLDTTPPTVTSTNPSNNATNVPVSAAVSVTFSKAMDSSTINTNTFTLKQGNTRISGTVTTFSGIATFTPSSNLAYNTTYTATITAGVKDYAGNSMVSDYSWGFTTTSTPPTSSNVLYVTNGGSDSVSVIDTSTNTVISSVAVKSIPQGIATDSSAKRAYVVNTGSSCVSVIDTNYNAVIATIWGVGSTTREIALNSSANKAYITDEAMDKIAVIDTTNHTVLTTIPVGSYPVAIAVSPSTNRAYVTNYFGNSVSVIDTSINSVISSINVSDPYGVAVNPSINRAYVTGRHSNTVSVIDTSNNTVVATIPVGSYPVSIAVNPSANRAYVTNNNSDSVSVIDTTTNTVVTTIAVGSRPWGAVVDPSINRAYVANYGNGSGNTVSIINTATNNVVATTTVGAGPFDVGVMGVAE